jgi:hypothetical protein
MLEPKHKGMGTKGNIETPSIVVFGGDFAPIIGEFLHRAASRRKITVHVLDVNNTLQFHYRDHL